MQQLLEQWLLLLWNSMSVQPWSSRLGEIGCYVWDTNNIASRSSPLQASQLAQLIFYLLFFLQVKTNQAFFLRVSWSQRTICVQSGEKTSLRVTFSSNFIFGFTFITFLSLLFRNKSPDSPLPESTLKFGLSFEAQTPVFQLQQLRSVGLGRSLTLPQKIGRKSSVFKRWAQSIYPEISCFFPGTYTRKKIIVSHLPLSTFSSLSASKSRKGSSFLFGMVDAKDFVLSFVRLSLASSIAAFFAPNCSLVRIYVLE